MRQRLLIRSVLFIGFHVQVGVVSALLPSLSSRAHSHPRAAIHSAPLPLAASPAPWRDRHYRQSLNYYKASALALSSTISKGENKVKAEDTKTTATTEQNSYAKAIISAHLRNANAAMIARIKNSTNKNDMNIAIQREQEKEMELAERALVRWVEEYRGRANANGDNNNNNMQQKLPDAQLFSDVIEGLLALPCSFAVPTPVAIVDVDNDNNSGDDGGDGGEPNINSNTKNDDKELNDQIRRTLLGKGKSLRDQSKNNNNNNLNQGEDNRSDRATRALDLMESFHEPTGSLYDTIIASHGADALQCLSYLTMDQKREGNKGDVDNNNNESGSKSKESLYYQQAWKSAKSALQLLKRSEELYHETGQSTSRLPSISSYVTMMDIWKALAVGAEEVGEKKDRDEALEIVRNVQQRRLKVYTLDAKIEGTAEQSGYSILPPGVQNMSVEEVLNFASNLLRDSVPTYQLKIEDPSKIGTWHFNQLIFDLAKYPQSFSGPLAQDLLDYMMYTVKQVSFAQRRRMKKGESPPPNIPKPNVKTINGVLKAWMVTKNYTDVARHAEAILAKLAIWQSEGTLWGVSADTVSYNTCINCWKESGISGAAQRATEILSLMEDETTTIVPDVISYTTCIGAWADCSSREPSAGRRAEDVLTRMYNRNKAAEGEESVAPRPTTRCFNAVMLAYANGSQKGRGKRALELLRFMERLNGEEGYTDLSPDTYTFNIVMKALANCGEKGASDKANKLLQRMEASFNKGVTMLKPDLLSYNTVLDAYSKEGDAKSAERLLEQMFNRGDDMVKPNAHSYTAVLTAWSRNEDKEMAARKAEDLFNNVEGRYAAGDSDFRADTSVYNALINCWSKSGERKALYRVTQILSLMEELGLQGGDSDVQPNSRTYCAVLDTLARSKNYKAYNMSLEVLKRMEAFHSEGYDSVRPCTRAYSIVLSTIARSRRRNKTLKAQELLHRMESEYRGGNSGCRPNVYSYNAVLNAAAFCGRDEKEQEDAFKVACITFDELRMSDYLKPSHVSYGTFLKAIRNLMPESEVRDDLVKGLFRKCCRDGLASDFVLKEVAGLSTPGLYQSLLEGVTNEYGNLPKSWSANVR